MKRTIERVTAMALERLGEGELYINRFGNAFWRASGGREIALGYTVLEAERLLIKLTASLDESPRSHEED
jgi:hypothetical protein